MNPPSALYGAMNKERKPFTYTPGGLDLSEIKSERMAQRLMRNAMSEGVPATPAHTIQSPPPVASGVLPNFNCLPVQVFPAFQLPANPKSLLRTRSNLDGPKDPLKMKCDNKKEINKPLLQAINNNIGSNVTPMPKNNYNENNSNTSMKTEPFNYGSYSHTDALLPEKSYEVDYFQVEPLELPKIVNKNYINKPDDKPLDFIKYNNSVYEPDFLLKSKDSETSPVVLTTIPTQDIATNNNDQKEVKIVTKQTNGESETSDNGDTNTAVVVKLPTKSTAAKTETKVEVVKKILPDGTVEEVKTTTTKTTVDGKTEIATKTETRIIPKETSEKLEIEEQGEETGSVVDEKESEEIVEESKTQETELANGEEVAEESDEEVIVNQKDANIISGEEKLETSTTKKVVVTQSTAEESEEEIEEEVEEEEEENGDVDVEEVVILKKPSKKEDDNKEDEENNVIEDEVVEDEAIEEEVAEEEKEVETLLEPSEEKTQVQDEEVVEDDQEEVVEEEESVTKKDEEVIEQDNENTLVTESKADEKTAHHEQEDEEEYEEAEDSELKPEVQEDIKDTKNEETTVVNIKIDLEPPQKNENKDIPIKEAVEPTVVKENTEKEQVKEEIIHKTTIESEPRVSFREPSIPFEKVEDIEIKPIGPAQEIIKKSHTEIITKTSDKPSGALSTQTEYNRIENIVTVNRTSKILDHAYEQTQQIPAIKTYFPPSSDRVLSTPQPLTRPYQPVFTPEPQTERRHSLLLERLSVDRQIPTADFYQNNYSIDQGYAQNQWSDEPQSEVLTVSNVKPSTITKNQQWYQQTKRENVLSNTVSPTPVLPSQLWSQQNNLQPQNQLPVDRPPTQTFTQQQYTPKPEYQATYTENNAQSIYKSNTNNLQANNYPSYTPKPSWVSSTFDSKPTPMLTSNQYSTITKESSESYQKPSQQFNSSYVPPPWEQDCSYVTDNQSYYQAPPPAASYTPTVNQQSTWKPNPAPSKFSKPTPTAYIPPAPNQSFVKPVTSSDIPKIAGRKTYYSEYERRYISVPESTYIPNETKFPAQPDPSPQYYYDNNEPTEPIEPQWRRELREFTEKTSQTTATNEKVRPPWEEDSKYAAPSEYTATVTPSWTQTLRPQSWRERSYEPEYVGSKEWPKTNTLGRGRPQSSYVKSNVDTIPERPRGVSVDRYNPNNYQSPLSSEHPPVQSHTLTIHPKTYHNPHVPGYHSRASAEPREQTPVYPQQRVRADSRAPPVQSRSFKYLQWITGTED